MLLVLRRVLRLAVRRAAAGGEDELLHPLVDHRLKQSQRRHDVQFRVRGRIGDGDAHVDLRRVMIDEIEAASAQFVDRGRIAQIGDDQLCLLVHVLQLAAAQVIDDDHLVTARDVSVDDVRSDESGTARDQHFHFEQPS